MPATIDTSNINFGTNPNGTATNVNVTCATLDNYLLSLLGQAGSAPTVEQYNSVSMLPPIGSLTFVSGFAGYISAAGLINPTTGSALTLNAQYASTAGFGLCGVPISGVKTGTAPTFSTNDGTSTTATVSVSGAGANDVQIGMVFCEPGASLTSTGTGQTHLITPQVGINGLFGFAVDYILGSSAGNFSWTLGTSNQWMTMGVTVYGTPAVPSSGPAARCLYVMP